VTSPAASAKLSETVFIAVRRDKQAQSVHPDCNNMQFLHHPSCRMTANGEVLSVPRVPSQPANVTANAPPTTP
jgi:hypothetical protein